MGSLDDDAAPYQDLDIMPAIVVSLAALGAVGAGLTALVLLGQHLWSLM